MVRWSQSGRIHEAILKAAEKLGYSELHQHEVKVFLMVGMASLASQLAAETGFGITFSLKPSIT